VLGLFFILFYLVIVKDDNGHKISVCPRIENPMGTNMGLSLCPQYVHRCDSKPDGYLLTGTKNGIRTRKPARPMPMTLVRLYVFYLC
jgi:hypothetical protein